VVADKGFQLGELDIGFGVVEAVERCVVVR
jgi:hypothetical protein